MIGSTGRRWKHICIAGAGLACLGAGTIFISGCSTTTVSDTRPSAKADQRVAGTKGTATGKQATAGKSKTSGKKPAQEIAKKGPTGKARVSDLDDESRVQMSARISQNKAQADASQNNSVAGTSGTSTAAAANKPANTPAQSAGQRQVARAPGSTNAAQPQRSPVTGAPAVAAKTRTTAGAITQTSGDSQPRSGSASRSVTTTSAVRPVITPRKSEWQSENGGEAVASNHERRRADRLMQRAYTMYESGYREEALRLASVAAELEYSQLAVYRRGEERPSDFVEFLLTASGKNTWSKTIEAAPQVSDRKSDSFGTSLSKVAEAAANAGTERSSSKSARNIGNDVLPAEATSRPQTPRDLKPAASNTPRFTAS
jgi:hypothetical protein